MLETFKNILLGAASLPLWPKIALSAAIIFFAILLLALLWFLPKHSGARDPVGYAVPTKEEVITLSENEEKALGIILTDPMAGGRGVFAYVLHGQLTSRGLTDAQTTISLGSLVSKGLLVSVDVEGKDAMGELKTAPAYKVTEKGIAYASNNEAIAKTEEIYLYTLRVHGLNQDNLPFLEHLRDLDLVERQTRFVSEDEPNVSRIAIFSYESISDELIRNQATMFKVSVIEFSEY